VSLGCLLLIGLDPLIDFLPVGDRPETCMLVRLAGNEPA